MKAPTRSFDRSFRLSANVENLVLQGSADLQGYGNSQATRSLGNSGNNILDGEAGADAMYGGAGNDVYFVDDAGDQAIENANEGIDTVFSTVAFAAVGERGEPGAARQRRPAGRRQQPYANVIYGNTGNNVLNGDAGADIMVGGDGNDVYFVDNIGDLVFENVKGTDAVFATVDYTLAANVETLVLQGAANIFGGRQCGEQLALSAIPATTRSTAEPAPTT